VHAGQTTTAAVTYTAISTSHRLWVGNSGASTLLGYDPAGLAASGAPAATVATDTNGSDGFTFDRAGNLWVLGGTTSDAPLARYPAAMFATSGAKSSDVIIDSPAFAGGVPGPKVVAFDDAGNLWVSVVWASKVVRFTPAQLAASGSPTPAVEIGGIAGPSGIAFDAAGNMFVAATGDDAIIRVDHSHLATSGSTADLTLSAMTPPPVIGSLAAPTGLAFDVTGGLWVDFGGTLARLTPADLAGTGSKMVTPAVQITLDVLALSEGIAFDEGGGLWVASSAGKFVCLAPTQLAVSGSVAPQVTISSADVGYAGWFAIYPAPAATPLAHRLP
jgi:sugar lactone lactonase YvrE